MTNTNSRARLVAAAAAASLAAATLADGRAAISRPAGAAGAPAATAERVATAPIRFEPNVGQTDERAKFVARAGGLTLFLTGEEAVFDLRGAAPAPAAAAGTGARRTAVATAPSAVVRMKAVGADPSARVTGESVLPGTSSYFVGDDPSLWRTKVPAYAKVRYENAYPGVDLVYYGGEHGLEFDFALAPGADARAIRLAFEGAESVSIDGGDLVVRTRAGELRQRAPAAYQSGAAGKRAVACRYVLGAGGEVGFDLGDHDATRPIVIDPVIVYSTLLGGSAWDNVGSVALGPDGYVYLAGATASPDFPVTDDSHGGRPAGVVSKAFVAKLTPDASTLVYSVTLGGSNGDWIGGIAVDAAGDVYVGGTAWSPDFPTVNPIQTDPDGVVPDGTSDKMSDGFATKIAADGASLVYSTYVCGSGADELNGVAVDAAGSLCLAGGTSSRDFPAVNAAQLRHGDDHGDEAPISLAFDIFVTKINAAGTAYEYSTYLGGSSNEYTYSVAVDAAGAAYVGGWSSSADYPTLNSMKSYTGAGDNNGVLTKLAADGSVAYSTFFGGTSGDAIADVAVDADGAAYLAGTATSNDFPVRNSLRPRETELAAFAAKIDSAGSSIVYCTYLSSGPINGGASRVAVDAQKNAVVLGHGYYPDGVESEQQDMILSKLNADGSALVYDEVLGGSAQDAPTCLAVDAAGAAYVGGSTWSEDFPTTLTPPLDLETDSTEGFLMKVGDPQFDMVARDDATRDLFRAVAKDPTDRDYGYWEYRVAATGETFYGRAASVLYDQAAGMKMGGLAGRRYKVKANFRYDRDTAAVVVTDRRTGERHKLVDRDNSETAMP